MGLEGVEIMLAIEDEFEITISAETWQELVTVDKICSQVQIWLKKQERIPCSLKCIQKK